MILQKTVRLTLDWKDYKKLRRLAFNSCLSMASWAKKAIEDTLDQSPYCGCCNCRDNRSRGAAEAHNLVHRAIKKGELPELDGSIPCSQCNKPATEYDHRDYNKPLKVTPVCRTCNRRKGPARLVLSIPTKPCLFKKKETQR